MFLINVANLRDNHQTMSQSYFLGPAPLCIPNFQCSPMFHLHADCSFLTGSSYCEGKPCSRGLYGPPGINCGDQRLNALMLVEADVK
jgi:hypothetical protein